MDLTVKRLREILEDALEQLDEYDDNDIVEASPNTYNLSAPYLATYQGFVELDEIRVENWNDDDDEEEFNESLNYRKNLRSLRNESTYRRKRFDELLGGLVGKVNAKQKDWEELALACKKDSWINDLADVKVAAGAVCLFFMFKKKLYSIEIEENGKDKIVVTLLKDKKELRAEKGLRFSKSKIINVAKEFMRDVSDDEDFKNIEKPSEVKSHKEKLDAEYKKWKKEREEEERREQEYFRKMRDDEKEKQKSNKSNKSSKSSDVVSSGRDWYEINPVNNSEVNGFEYGRL